MYCENCDSVKVDEEILGGNCGVCRQPLGEMLEGEDMGAKKQSENKLNGTLELYDAIPHCTLKGESCCGIFMVVEDGVVICNECNKSLTEVVMQSDATTQGD